VIEVCGTETVSLVNPANKAESYLKNSGVGSKQRPFTYSSLFKVDSIYCPITTFDILNPDDSAFTQSFIAKDTVTKDFVIETTFPFDYTVKLKASTLSSPNTVAQLIRATVCNTDPKSTLSSDPDYVFNKNQNSGVIMVGDLTTWFKDFGVNCPLALLNPHVIKNTDGTAYSDGVAYLAGNQLKIKTNAPYVKALKIEVTTKMGATVS
jgi:hypothetical protein